MLVEAGLLFLLILLFAYYYVTKQWGFFTALGVPYGKPTFPFGSSNAWQCFTGKAPLTDTVKLIVEEEFPKERVFGYFAFGQPNFVINDEDLAKRILIKDFEHFSDRRTFKSSDSITNAFMINLTGTSWKKMRSLMSGVFTSGKLKLMVNHILKTGKNLELYIRKIAEEGTEVDMKVVGGYMTLDSIATAGFGIETNSFDDPNNTFRVQALTLVQAPGYTSRFNILKFVFIVIFPKLAKIMHIDVLDKVSITFFSDIIRKTYRHRLESGDRRNDIIDIIVDEIKSSKNKGTSKPEVYESEFEKDAALDTSDINNDDALGFDEETLLISNALLFFFAGFETTSTGISVCCHRLALHPDIQERLYDEIVDILGDSEEVTFQHIQELKYMDQFISEAFRLNPMINAHERLCTKDYKIPGSDIVIPKGRYVQVYTPEISMSKNNFKNPKEFDPDNFAPENNPNKFGLMLFGQGPRNCIGMRYALLTIKVTLLSIVRSYRCVRGLKTTDKLVIDISNLNVFKDGVFVKFEKR